jgi:hypothetical protein
LVVAGLSFFVSLLVTITVGLVVRRRVEERWLDLIGGVGFVCTGWTRVFHVFLFFSCLYIFSLFFFVSSLSHTLYSCPGVGIYCRTGAASRRKHPPSKSNLMWQMCGDKEFMSFISGKMEWESPSSILVTRNPNWSQRSGTETGCVKGRY